MDTKKSPDWARELVQRHANAARALEHMYTERNVERLKAIGAELEAALSAPAEATPAAAWMTEDGDRVITDAAKRTMPRAVQAPYTVALGRTAEATQAVAVPEGWQLVPVKPTGDMLDAMLKPWHDGSNRGERETLEAAHAGMLAAAPQAPVVDAARAEQHPDDVAIDAFAVAMKAKMARAREKGRAGWEQCDPADLSRMLREHVEKGDPRDVANFCMFLWYQAASIAPAARRPAIPSRRGSAVSNPRLERWLQEGRHLPRFMRDFHDQKDLFRAIHQTICVRNTEHIGGVTWVEGQIYVIDIFLWWMARRGYTLQPARADQEFMDIHETIRKQNEIRNAAETAELKSFLAGDQQ